MNYQAIYNALIEKAKTREIYIQYTEKHHIIPRSEGGSNKKENKVELTMKEHHLAHLLLLRMGRCLKYCYVGYTLKEYVDSKMKEKAKKHLLTDEKDFSFEDYTYNSNVWWKLQNV